MVKKLSKKHIKRKFNTKKNQLSQLGQSANKHIDRHVFRRWSNLQIAKRFVIGWLSLVILLISGLFLQITVLGKSYLQASPVAGGFYSEGVIGEFTNANPIFASNPVDSSVSKLVFSSLLSYDDNGKLVGDLASGWTTESNGLVYVVKLKPGIKWHDGKNFTADDVVYTYETIQNPDVKSPLATGWAGVKVQKSDDLTVKFTLPSQYAPFPNLLTNGVVPQHLLANKPINTLRGDLFNTKKLVGTGPFKFESTDDLQDDQKVIKLIANKEYFKSEPKLKGVSIITYNDQDKLLADLNNKKLTVASGVNEKDSEIKLDDVYSFPQNSATMLFLKNSSSNLSDTKVRQALVKATKTSELTKLIGYSTIPVREPILEGQIGYNKDYWQYSYNKTEAEQLLDQAGWLKVPGSQYRQKDGKDLTLKLVSENNDTYPNIATELQKQWAEVGVKLEPIFISAQQITQTQIPNHEYDVLLYGINIGPDPDVYAYWHSSQAATNTARLNLSEYKSTFADLALESGRSRQDPSLRAAKYKNFLSSWKNDAPAVGLYQPRYLMLASQPVYGVNPNRSLNNPQDRYNNIEKWMINTARSQK